MKVFDLKARQIFDSRGVPTVEVDLFYKKSLYGRASVPSGASTGQNEVIELRDGGNDIFGKVFFNIIDNINNMIKPEIINKKFKSVNEFDDFLLGFDTSLNKGVVGGNAFLAVSLAFLKAYALNEGIEIFQYFDRLKKMPKLMFNILNGGVHSDSGIDIQEFMIVPNKETIVEQTKVSCEIYHNLKKLLKSNGFSTSVGDEGGFAPRLSSNYEALDYIVKAIEMAGYKKGEEVNIALDVAANSFYDGSKYKVDGKSLSCDELIDMYLDMVSKYPIISIEDPFYEEDFNSFSKLKNKLNNILIVGDDLVNTNFNRIKKAIDCDSVNAIIIKPNQIGTISETIECINYANYHNIKCMVSHRSGDTCDSFISDLVVGMGLDYMKSGALCRGERTSKYNRLLRIEEFI